MKKIISLIVVATLCLTPIAPAQAACGLGGRVVNAIGCVLGVQRRRARRAARQAGTAYGTACATKQVASAPVQGPVYIP